MNKKIAIIVIVILAIIGGGVAFLLMQEDDPADQAASTSQQETQSESPQPTSAAEEPAANSAGTYTDYDESKLVSTQGTKVIFFHAPWCPQCRALEADIEEQGVPAGVTIFKADYDTSQDLRQKYGVTIQTTLVKVDDQGNEIQKYVAYDEPTIAAVKENLL